MALSSNTSRNAGRSNPSLSALRTCKAFNSATANAGGGVTNRSTVGVVITHAALTNDGKPDRNGPPGVVRVLT